jgi:hypothetical protein
MTTGSAAGRPVRAEAGLTLVNYPGQDGAHHSLWGDTFLALGETVAASRGSSPWAKSSCRNVPTTPSPRNSLPTGAEKSRLFTMPVQPHASIAWMALPHKRRRPVDATDLIPADGS